MARADDRESLATSELGSNFLDTADKADLLGRAVRGRKDEVVVATKCGFVGSEDQDKLLVSMVVPSTSVLPVTQVLWLFDRSYRGDKSEKQGVFATYTCS